jgi:hypothetical protein
MVLDSRKGGDHGRNASHYLRPHYTILNVTVTRFRPAPWTPRKEPNIAHGVDLNGQHVYRLTEPQQ